jgi:hypothetical protein
MFTNLLKLSIATFGLTSGFQCIILHIDLLIGGYHCSQVLLNFNKYNALQLFQH